MQCDRLMLMVGLSFLTLSRWLTTDRSEERFSRNAETDLVCRLLLEKKNCSEGRVPSDPHADGYRPETGALLTWRRKTLALRATAAVLPPGCPGGRPSQVHRQSQQSV